MLCVTASILLLVIIGDLTILECVSIAGIGWCDYNYIVGFFFSAMYITRDWAPKVGWAITNSQIKLEVITKPAFAQTVLQKHQEYEKKTEWLPYNILTLPNDQIQRH